MQLNEIKILLGYSSVQSMLDLVGLKYKNMMRIKVENTVRYNMIINEIILKHNNINTKQLINMVETYNRLKSEV